MLKFTFALITKLCKKEVTWCSLSLSLNHLSSLRYSRRDARAARSMTNTNGEPFNSIDNAYRKNKKDKLNKMTQLFKGWSLAFEIERQVQTVDRQQWCHWKSIFYYCTEGVIVVSSVWLLIKFLEGTKALKQEALFFSKVKKWRHYLAQTICNSFQEN